MTDQPSIAPAPHRLRLLTYNVHSCIGRDRRLDVARIAKVIASCNADIIALQELDVGRLRTGLVDQAEAIAAEVRMTSHFHPALHVEDEQYGDAILTALPSVTVRSQALPSIGETRGAIWVRVTVAGREVNIFNTHFGLRRRERLLQADELLGPDWLDSDACKGVPTIVTGDFNAVPRSQAFRKLASRLRTGDVRRMRATFPSGFPLLRLDHVFHTEGIELLELAPVMTPLARVASDHLPLLAEFSLPAV
ncbi:endonuclease/exonuclease/phosphatase family protein [Rhizobium sp. RU36D]|uniref:endonuclease/exonuclease/phosphatase family protein n=1 Tax=Rhizobium sp. RU36D TaxID=1907415 RepID=UPI0009D82F85|nr:endonuclease/exonuclease/phosphatase family protein [Rhizobium sp. RU36D]SMC51917.1 Metal-dependent hydrolase, endonuclease/exonuclease/phosphatase family [Rhizobium sp. RU36D]